MGLPKDYFYKERAVLKVTGLSLTGNESWIYKIYSFVYLLIFNYSYPFLEIGDLFKHEFNQIADIMIYEFAAFLGAIKTTVMLRNRLKIGKILDKMEKAPFAPNFERGGKLEESLIRSCMKFTNTQIWVYWVFASLSWVSALIYSTYRRLSSSDPHDWIFSYGAFTIINVTHSPNYEIAWLYQTYSIGSAACHFVTIDLLTAALLAHISYQFKILNNCVKKLVETGYRKMLKENGLNSIQTIPESNGITKTCPWKYLQKSLQEAVEYHLAILDLVKDFEEIFSGMLFLVFLGTLGMMCFNAYHSTQMQSNARLLQTIAESACMCLQILSVCYWGEQIKTESEEIGRAAYESKFVGTDLRFQKGLVVIIRRTQYPTKVTALKFTDVCLSTFAWTIRTSYSAFMVLQSSKKN